MPKVRGGSTERWVAKASQATGDYKAGVQTPRASWKASTLAAADAHSAAVTKAVANKSFEKGVNKSDDGYWQTKAAGVGADRFAPGVEAGKGNFAEGVAPYLQVIESTTLPPRGPKGDVRNFERVKVMAMALHKKKTGQ
jgi:hypothetical protein